MLYIMCSPNRATLYIGVTSNLYNRVSAHRNKVDPNCFTAMYNCTMLVYYNGYDRIEEAIAAEKKLKDRARKHKEKLINDFNPQWNDLWDAIQGW